MRKILLFLIVIMATLTVGAQKILEGTKPSLKGVNKISLKIDFSENYFDEITQEENASKNAEKSLFSKIADIFK